MTRPLLRACLDCRTLVRGKTRCVDCQRRHDLAKSRAKAARRPGLHADAYERERRRRVVADHRAMVGDWCPSGSADPPTHRPTSPPTTFARSHAAAAPMARWSFAAGHVTPPDPPTWPTSPPES